MIRRLCLVFLLCGCSADTFTGIIDDSGPGDVQSDTFGVDGASGDSQSSDGDGGLSDAIVDVLGDGWDGYSQPYRRVFITSKNYAPNFGSLAAGDAICASVASGAGLGGKWAAWLSSSTSSAASRLEHSSVPYELLDGTIVASNWAGLTSGVLIHDIDHDEHGAFVPYQGTNYPYSGITATGTYSDGTAAPNNTCNDWATAVGYSVMDGVDDSKNSSSTYPWWTELNGTSGGGSCQIKYMLYCVEQP